MKIKEFQQRQALDQLAEIKRILSASLNGIHNRTPASILVSSAEQEEGKSLIAAALAVSAARSGNTRVAILDANWFNPSLHKFFQIDLEHSRLEINNGELRHLVHHIQDLSLDILTAPSDYSNKINEGEQINLTLKRFIDQAINTYDLTIIDGGAIFPPNRFMIDPVMISSLTTGVILVIKSGATSRQEVKRAIKILETNGAKILGVVSNQWQVRTNKHPRLSRMGPLSTPHPVPSV